MVSHLSKMQRERHISCPERSASTCVQRLPQKGQITQKVEQLCRANSSGKWRKRALGAITTVFPVEANASPCARNCSAPPAIERPCRGVPSRNPGQMAAVTCVPTMGWGKSAYN